MKRVSLELFIPENSKEKVIYRTMEETEYPELGIVVPKGFYTDGASVPKLFRGIFPDIHQYFPATLLHDFLIFERRKVGKMTSKIRKEIDKKFYNQLLKIGVSKTRSKIMYLGVRIYAFFNYRK